jgi:hypothetical protein
MSQRKSLRTQLDTSSGRRRVRGRGWGGEEGKVKGGAEGGGEVELR